ncbi:FliG C-terminal domain-containing protein [Henriciella sp.]|uniref:flagellar motor switch protein FliG n=1 Tax=Henriciella sp. TaxID=1968823 RepID=UPI00262B7A81|nr:FliG C-terminal domain-containing protein [Henriciella sp.]
MSLPATKMSPPLPSSSPGTQRAARLMKALGPSASAVWAELSPDEASQLSTAMELNGPAGAASGPGGDTAALIEAFTSIPDRQGDSGISVWSRMARLDPAIIANFIEHEHPQLVGVILSRLGPETAAHVVRLMPRPLATTALRRLMNLGRVRGEALKVVEAAMNDLVSSRSGQQSGEGAENVARIFDRLDPRLEQGFMSALDRDEPGSATRIRALMFTFDDLSALDPGAVQTILSSVDRGVLAIALKGAKTPVRQVFLRNMTKRAGELLSSEIDGLGPVRRSAILEARNEVTAIARRLAKRGEILAANDEEDELIE